MFALTVKILKCIATWHVFLILFSEDKGSVVNLGVILF